MNDRFKFRAWDKKHGIMVYCEEEASREQIHEYEALYDWDEDYGCWEYKCLSGLDSLIRDDDFVVEQCTGLRDENGKLIYEGDIIVKSDVSAIGYSRTRVCKVHWHNDWLSWAITTQYGDTYELSEFEPQQYEIIGNIHENADLLEVEND